MGKKKKPRQGGVEKGTPNKASTDTAGMEKPGDSPPPEDETGIGDSKIPGSSGPLHSEGADGKEGVAGTQDCDTRSTGDKGITQTDNAASEAKDILTSSGIKKTDKPEPGRAESLPPNSIKEMDNPEPDGTKSLPSKDLQEMGNLEPGGTESLPSNSIKEMDNPEPDGAKSLPSKDLHLQEMDNPEPGGTESLPSKDIQEIDIPLSESEGTDISPSNDIRKAEGEANDCLPSSTAVIETKNQEDHADSSPPDKVDSRPADQASSNPLDQAGSSPSNPLVSSPPGHAGSGGEEIPGTEVCDTRPLESDNIGKADDAQSEAKDCLRSSAEATNTEDIRSSVSESLDVDDGQTHGVEHSHPKDGESNAEVHQNVGRDEATKEKGGTFQNNENVDLELSPPQGGASYKELNNKTPAEGNPTETSSEDTLDSDSHNGSESEDGAKFIVFRGKKSKRKKDERKRTSVNKVKKKLNANLLFYQGKIRSKPDNVFIHEMHDNWYGKMDLLESKHGYIQWLFPISESQGMNWQAQALQPDEAEALKQDELAMARLLESYKMMLNFYGMELVDEITGQVGRAANWKERFQNLNFSSHNHLRVTRILKCLGELGLERLKYPLLEFLVTEVLGTGELRCAMNSCHDFWIGTLADDFQRTSLENHAIELELQAHERNENEKKKKNERYPDVGPNPEAERGTTDDERQDKDQDNPNATSSLFSGNTHDQERDGGTDRPAADHECSPSHECDAAADLAAKLGAMTLADGNPRQASEIRSASEEATAEDQGTPYQGTVSDQSTGARTPQHHEKQPFRDRVKENVGVPDQPGSSVGHSQRAAVQGTRGRGNRVSAKGGRNDPGFSFQTSFALSAHGNGRREQPRALQPTPRQPGRSWWGNSYPYPRVQSIGSAGPRERAPTERAGLLPDPGSWSSSAYGPHRVIETDARRSRVACTDTYGIRGTPDFYSVTNYIYTSAGRNHNWTGNDPGWSPGSPAESACYSHQAGSACYSHQAQVVAPAAFLSHNQSSGSWRGSRGRSTRNHVTRGTYYRRTGTGGQ